MSVFEDVLKEELERAKSHIDSYEEILSHLQKGYLSKMKISGRMFVYLKWREGKTIKSKYIGVEGSPQEIEARNNYFERKRIESNLRAAKEEARKIERALEAYGR